MEGLRAEHRVDGLRSQTGGLGAPRDPRDVIVRSGGAPHPVARLNGDDAHAAIGDKPCGDTGAGAMSATVRSAGEPRPSRIRSIAAGG